MLRAVADTAETDLPPLAMTALKDDGRLDFAAPSALSLLRHPRQVPSLVAMAKSAKAARAALLARLEKLPERTF